MEGWGGVLPLNGWGWGALPAAAAQMGTPSTPYLELLFHPSRTCWDLRLLIPHPSPLTVRLNEPELRKLTECLSMVRTAPQAKTFWGW